MINPHVVIFAVAASAFVFAMWRARRERFETPEERWLRKIREAETKLNQISPAHRPLDFEDAHRELAGRIGSQPIGYSGRLGRKLGIVPPRNLRGEVDSGQIYMSTIQQRGGDLF